MALDFNALVHDPKNLATALVLAAALAQPRDQGRNGLQTALQRGVGALAFRGETEQGISDAQRQDRLDSERAAEAARRLAAEEETARAQTAEVGARREATASAERTAAAERDTQLKLRATPQAQTPAQEAEARAHARFYDAEGQWMQRRPDKDQMEDLLKLYPQTPEGSRSLLNTIAGITSMVDPLQQGEILKSYYPILGIHGIIPFKDKTGRVGFQMPDDLANQIRGVGGAPGVPQAPPPQAAPTPPPPTNQSVGDVLGLAQQQQQQQAQQQQRQNVINSQNAATYRAERGKLSGMSQEQFNAIAPYRKQMNPVTGQAFDDEDIARRASTGRLK